MKKQWCLVGLLIVCLLIAARPNTDVAADATAQIADTPRYAALTFDDGPKRSTTERLLDGLQQRGAKATFFVIGQEIAGNEDLLQRMKADGHQIGNHTWGHVRAENVGEKAFLQDVQRTNEALSEVVGEEAFWLRPPYGFVTEEMRRDLTVPIINWSVDSRDWESRNKKTTIDAVMEAVHPGSIILLHDIYPTSVDAALEIADRLMGQGYELVTVRELLARSGITPEPGQVYRSGAEKN